LVTLLLAACGGGERAEPKPARSTASPPPDSLALTLPGGAEIWFTGSRTATGADGTRCVERVMEIREGGSKRMIPLLYTGTLPTRVNDTTIEAAIWLDCRPGNVYQVNIRTGQPVRVK
jgi:hypothetical protein